MNGCTTWSTETPCQFGCEPSTKACRLCSPMQNQECHDSACQAGTYDCQGECVRRNKPDGTRCAPASCSDRNNALEESTCRAGACQPGRKCDYHGCDANQRCTNMCPSDAPSDTGTACEACGHAGTKCCGGTTCDANSFCEGFVCLACGGAGQPCCTNKGCRGGLTCFDAMSGPPGKCNTPCGAAGQRCCEFTESPLPCPDGAQPDMCGLDSKCR